MRTCPDTAVSPSGNRKASRAARTRERILQTSLDLFNTHGEAHVTTGHIADELNISPGNLYYHFRNKGEIIRHLFGAFEARVDAAPSLSGEDFADAGTSLENLWLYLHLMFEGIRDYRFLYRNLDDLLMRDTKLRMQFRRILDHKRSAVSALCQSLARGGAMRASAAEIALLADNVLLVATYWLNFDHLAANAFATHDAADNTDLGRGVYQVMALIAPYLTEGSREHLEHISRQYLGD
jgi:AcrR family transcriptional regulator